MASHPNRSLRRKLLERGVSRRFIPRTRLAQLTAYIVGITVVFGALWHTLLWTNGNAGAISFASWWYNATRVVSVFLLLWLGLRWVREHLLWSLRRRLFVTYFFIGVIPILLLAALGGIAFYLIGNQYAASLVGADLRAELDSLRVAGGMVAGEIAVTPAKPGAVSEGTFVRIFRTHFPSAEVVAWEEGNSSPILAVPGPANFTAP